MNCRLCDEQKTEAKETSNASLSNGRHSGTEFNPIEYQNQERVLFTNKHQLPVSRSEKDPKSKCLTHSPQAHSPPNSPDGYFTRRNTTSSDDERRCARKWIQRESGEVKERLGGHELVDS
jgi:hypothetical protein